MVEIQSVIFRMRFRENCENRQNLMDVKHKTNSAPKIVVWYGRVIICLGVICFALGIVAIIGNYLKEDGDILNSLYSLYEFVGLAVSICGFGVAISRGKRWYIFALLILVFFGSFVIGLFSMVGRETTVGYYIWAIGGIISLSLISILIIYWERLLDG